MVVAIVQQPLCVFIPNVSPLNTTAMIKKTLYFGNPAYLSLRNNLLVIKLPEVERCDALP